MVYLHINKAYKVHGNTVTNAVYADILYTRSRTHLNIPFINYYSFVRFTFDEFLGCHPAVNQGERRHQELQLMTTHHHDGGVAR